MPNIPTFSAGTLLKDIREKSLNPAIDKINSLDTGVTSLKGQVTNLETKSDKSIIDVSQPQADQLQFTHGDSSKHVITIAGTKSAEIETSGLQEHEIVSWDPDKGKFVGTGVLANLGEIIVAPGSVIFGQHTMSSSGENVVFTNEASGKNYTPVWQEQKAGSNTAYLRVLNKDIKERVLIPVGNADVINPSFRIVTPDDVTVFGAKFTLTKAATNVVAYAYDVHDHPIWEDKLGDLESGDVDVNFKIPFDSRVGIPYTIKVLSLDGDLVAKGPVAGTGVAMSVIGKGAGWVDRIVPSVELNMSSGVIPTWNSFENKLASTGVSSVDGDIITGPEGLLAGQVKLSSSESGFTVTPPGSYNGQKILTQNVAGGNEVVYSRKYGSHVETTISDKTTEDLTGRLTFTVDAPENVSLTTISIYPTVPTSFVKFEIFNASGDEVWSHTFYKVGGRSEQELIVPTSPDLKKGERYLFLVKGVAQSTLDTFQLKGEGSTPYCRLGFLPWTGEELATRTWVNNQGTVVHNPAEVFIESFTTTQSSPTEDQFFDQRTLFIYKGSGEGSLTLPALPSNGGVDNTYALVRNSSSDGSNLIINTSGTDKIGDGDLTSFTLPTGYTAMVISDTADGRWLWVVIEEGRVDKSVKDVSEKSDGSGITVRFTDSTSKDIDFPAAGTTLDPSKIVKNITPNNNGKDLTVFYYDDSNVTVRLDGWTSDIDGLQKSINTLKNKINSRTRFFVYSGATAPSIPKGTRGGYYLTFAGMASDLDITTPVTSGTISDGTIFFIDNNSDQYSINITPGKTGQTFDGSPSVQVLPDTVSWFIKDNGNWHTLFSGYLPSSFKHMVTEVKANLLADDTFLRDIQVQGDQPSADVLSCDKLEFAGCKVAADPKDSRRGIITVDSGISFVNPDGSSVTNTKFKLVGMEVKDPGDGTPPKIHLLTDHGTPAPHPTSAYAFFSTDKDAPGTVPFQTLPVFRGGRVTVHKDTTAPQYVYIMLPPGEGDDAERVGELGGLPAYWAKQSKDYTVGVGQVRTYTVFRSPYPFTEKDVTLVIYP